jgi:membrane protein YdbS with pleckstrin-like domain
MTESDADTDRSAEGSTNFDTQTEQTHAPGQWRRVSPSYVWVDLVGNLIPIIIVGAVAVALPILSRGQAPAFMPLILGVIALLLVINAAFGVRRVRAIGYQLRQDDLLFRRGIMFERVVAVPYGRMQLIDTQRGPVLRALRLSTLRFVTAAAGTNVQLPGLREADAIVLRDQLVALAETRRSGL